MVKQCEKAWMALLHKAAATKFDDEGENNKCEPRAFPSGSKCPPRCPNLGSMSARKAWHHVPSATTVASGRNPKGGQRTPTVSPFGIIPQWPK